MNKFLMLMIGLLICCCQNSNKPKYQKRFFCENSYLKFQVVIEKNFDDFYQDTISDQIDSDYMWRFRDSVKQVVIDIIYGMPSQKNNLSEAEKWIYSDDFFRKQKFYTIAKKASPNMHSSASAYCRNSNRKTAFFSSYHLKKEEGGFNFEYYREMDPESVDYEELIKEAEITHGVKFEIIKVKKPLKEIMEEMEQISTE